MNISIDPAILEITPQFRVAIMTCDIVVDKTSKVDKLVAFYENEIKKNVYKMSKVLTIIVDGCL